MLLCAPVLLDRRARRQRDPERGHRRRRRRRCSRASRAARRSRRSRSPSRTASGTRAASRWRRTRSGDGYTLDGDEDVRDRRPHRRPHRRRRPHRGHERRRTASRSSPSPATPPGLTRTALADDGPDPQAGEARVRRRRRRRRSATPGAGWAGAVARRSTRPRSALAERDGRRRAEGARDVGRVREGPRAVRPPDRLVPGDQAQVRRHAARGRVGQVGRVLRGVGRGRGQRRAAGGRQRSPRRTAPTRTSTPRPRTSRSTAASASPGSTTRTSTSSGRRAPRSSSATPRTTASCSRSASASEPTRAQGARNRGFSMSSGCIRAVPTRDCTVTARRRGWRRGSR